MGNHMAFWQKQFSQIRNKRSVPSLSSTVEALETWFESPMGQQLLADQQGILDSELSNLFGYHLMQLSINRNAHLFDASRIWNCFAAGVGEPDTSKQVGVFSDFDELPFENESIDVTILHHVLEFSDNPHQVLREASRVTIARGYIIIFGFNPFSLMGLTKPFAQLASPGAIWRRSSLRKSRISDWLQFLDCNTLRVYHGCYNPPLQNRRVLDHFGRLNRCLQKWHMPFGNYYCLVARKDHACLTPIRPDWSKESKLSSVRKRALSARTAARLAVVRDKPSKHY